VEYDLNIKQQKIQGSPVQELLEKPPLKEKCDGMYEALKAEDDAKPDYAMEYTIDIDIIGNSDDDAPEQETTKPNTLLADACLAENAKPWVFFVKNKYNRVVKLIVDPASADGVSEALSTWFRSLEMDIPADCNIVCFYDGKLAGHPSARAHLRCVPFREAHYNRMIKGAIKGLGGDEELPDNVVFCTFDAGVHGNDVKFGKPFTDEEGKAFKKEKRILFLQTTEKSLTEQRGNYSGVYALPTMEFVVTYSKQAQVAPEKKKVFSDGSNKDPVIGNFDKPANDDVMVFKVKHGLKTKLYGSAYVMCGGSVRGDTDKDDRGESTKAKDVVPFNHHTMNIKCYEELGSGLNGVGHVDLTCCDGVLAIYSLIKDIPYFGVCYTEEQKNMLEKFIQNTYLELMHTPGHPVFDQAFADLLVKKPQAAGLSAPAATSTGSSGVAKQPSPVATSVKKARTQPAGKDCSDIQAALAAKLAELDST